MARTSLSFFAALLLLTTLASAEPKVSEYTNGGWHDIAGAPVPFKDDLTLDRVEQLLDAHQYDEAHKTLSPWLKANGAAPDRDRALYLLAQINYEQDNRIVSFYFCDELMDKYPESRFFSPALELQYKIADAFLNGRKRKFLGMRLLPADDEGIEMLYRIQARSPGSAMAERALLRTADYYFRTSQFDLSGDAYAAFARSYPRSPEIPAVRLRQAFSSLAQFRGMRYDITPLLDARSQFKDIIEKYPQLAAEENVPDRIERIDATLAGKLYLTADFYRRTDHQRAAVYLYRTLIETYPTSRDAESARQALVKMPAWAQQAAPQGEIAPGARLPSRPVALEFQDRTLIPGHPSHALMTTPMLTLTRYLRITRLTVGLSLCVLGAGCGYQHSGSMDNAADGYKWHTLYRDDVKTVAVPIFQNRTYYRGVEFALTKAVVNQLEGQSPYKVVAREQADTVLEGEIERVRVQTSSNSPITALPQDQLYVVSVDFRWRDLRTGKILVERKRFEQTASYYPTLGEGQFVGDQLVVERLALAIVQEMQSDWGTVK